MRPRPKRNGPNTRIMLDGAAADHIRLLADPCNGKMVYPAYPSGQNGAVMRLRSVIQLGIGAGETCGMFHWTPGANEYYCNGAATPSTTFAPVSSSVFSLLQTAAASNNGTMFRCVAACVKILYNGSENNRGGVIYAGNTAAASFGASTTGGVTATVATSVAPLPYTTRVPSNSMEVLWVPNEADQNYFSDNANSGASVRQDSSTNAAITIGLIGLTAAVGVTLEVTGVYEVQFGATNNLVSSVGPPASSSPWSSVIRGLFDKIGGSTVLLNGVKSAIDYASVMGPATMGANAARLALSYL